MANEDVMSIFYEFFILTVKMAGPILVISMAIGVIIAVFQAATQIHEQTVTFVPKLLVIGILLLIFGSTMLVMMQDYTRELFSMI